MAPLLQLSSQKCQGLVNSFCLTSIIQGYTYIMAIQYNLTPAPLEVVEILSCFFLRTFLAIIRVYAKQGIK